MRLEQAKKWGRTRVASALLCALVLASVLCAAPVAKAAHIFAPICDLNAASAIADLPVLEPDQGEITALPCSLELPPVGLDGAIPEPDRPEQPSSNDARASAFAVDVTPRPLPAGLAEVLTWEVAGGPREPHGGGVFRPPRQAGGHMRPPSQIFTH